MKAASPLSLPRPFPMSPRSSLPFLAAVALLALPAAAGAEDDCFSPGASGTVELGDGATLRCGGSPAALAGSVHADMDCADCHSAVEADGLESRADFRLQLAATCLDCHDFEGAHAGMVGDGAKVSCAECHGGHRVQPAAELGADGCLACHGKPIEKKLENGETLPLQVDESHLEASVHEGMDCADCHAGYTEDEHPVKKFKSVRDARIQTSTMCEECHSDMYSRMLEGVHYALIQKGNHDAPVCQDCHGTHNIGAGQVDKLESAKRCRSCHEKTYDQYTQSVHGKALLQEGNRDVPVCSDCHKSHAIADPRKPGFALATPEICATCHANEELMEKYGLSTAVLDTYLVEFHGVTGQFYKMEGGEPQKRIGTCTACHGFHDITRTSGPDAGVMKEKLVSRCATCHEGATADFPDAWISHYEPSPKRAAIVWLVDLGYKFLIPFMIVGLLVQVFMHVYRYTVIRNQK